MPPTTERWSTVDRYITDLLIGPDAALDGALAASDAAGLPSIAVSPPQGKLLHLFARAVSARNILEIGTLGGYSTIWLARALQSGGHLVTLEYDPKHAAVAQANLVHAGFADIVEVRVGRASDTLPQLLAEGRGPFDLIFIDADKVGYPEYLEWSLKLSRPGTLIIADNVVRDGAVADAASTDANVLAVRRYNAMLAAEPRVNATVVQTVGSKGYDGLAIALVTS
jgi:predicted O-methyltransferase YrrM